MHSLHLRYIYGIVNIQGVNSWQLVHCLRLLLWMEVAPHLIKLERLVNPSSLIYPFYHGSWPSL